ncbi:MAG TPA: hypothetical protein VGS80_19140, partial [Ktedonobacterales bacterium]|nr:hypothetical protein [Ktedonobacterales bacterium]
MNMDTNPDVYTNHATPMPTPFCAIFAPLLPLLDSRELDVQQAAPVREHVAKCQWCAARLAQHEVVDAALRRHYGPGAPVDVPIALEDIMQGRFADSDAPSETTPTARLSVAPWRRTRARFSSLAAIAAVLLVAVLAALAFSGRGRLGAGPASTPTPTLAPGQDQILLADTAPWGGLTVNGREVVVPADPQTPITLPPGRDTLFYSAPPFPDLRCTISVPAASGDTCPLYVPSQYAGDATPTAPQPATVRVIDAGAVPSRLPPAALNALIASVQRTLDRSTSSTTVQPGDHYLSAGSGVAVAAQPFTARLSFQLLNESVSLNGESCDPFCLGPGPQPAVGAGIHLIMFPVPVWSYTPPGSAPVTTNEAPANGNAIDVVVDWTGSGWQVAVAPILISSTLLEVPSVRLDRLLAGNTGWGESGAAVASPAAEGGLIFAGVTDTNGWVLYHFGVLVA